MGAGEKGVNNPQTKKEFFLIALKQQNISLSDNNIMTQTLNKKRNRQPVKAHHCYDPHIKIYHVPKFDEILLHVLINL